MLERIALQKKLISKQDCLKAMKACKSAENYEKALKDYFITNKLIHEKTILRLIYTIDVIKIMKASIKFGSVAVKMGFITQNTLDTALASQKKSVSAQKRPQLIGQILVDSGKMSKQQIARVIKEQKKETESQKTTEPPLKIKPVAQESVPDPIDDHSREPEKIGGGMLLEIEGGGMSAYLKKTDTFDDNLIVDDIYSILLTQSIQYGLANEGAIQGFINSSGFKTNRFKVATGTQRIIGKNARIEYYFDTDHLKAGGMDEEGNIDFKDRGEIPRIEANALLAEKFPLKESKNGRDIFGNELETEPAKDVLLKTRFGVLISEDGRYAYSEISGHPKLSWSGNINVVDTYNVDGNVGYKTGHLTYEGNIDVQGSLKSGFQVKGYDVKIKEIDGGQIHAEGDVTIVDGVNGATIYSRGHVSANFIHDSEINCLGNLYVEKEIVDSKIETSGSCHVKTGKIINTQITSNQGVHAKDIGTDKTQPNTITVGQDFFVKNELVRIEKQIIEFEKQKIKSENKKDSLFRENQEHQQSTTKIANELEKTSEDKKIIEKDLNDIENNSKDKKESQNLNTLLQQQQALFTRLDKQLNERFDNIEKNEAKAEEITEILDTIDDQIEDLNQERENYIDWGDTNPGKSVIIAEGKVCSGTIIQGKHSQKEIKETVSNVQIKEGGLSGDMNNTNLYEIQIHDNIRKK